MSINFKGKIQLKPNPHKNMNVQFPLNPMIATQLAAYNSQKCVPKP